MGILLLFTAGAAVAALDPPAAAGATGSAPAPDIEQIRAYCDQISHASARNLTLIGLAVLAIVVAVAVFAGAQHRSKLRAFAELQDLQAALRAIGTLAQDALVISDERGEITYWNPAAEALYGMAPEQAQGRPLPSLFAQDHGLAPDFLDLVPGPAPVKDSTPQFKGIDAVRLNGDRIPVRAAFAPLRRTHAYGALGLIRKACTPIECTLEPEIASLIVDNTQESIVVTDAAGTIVRANPAYCRLTGYAQEELVGQNQHILNSGRHDHSFFQAMWRALLNEGRWEGKIWNRRKDGSLFLENLNIVALRGEEGTATYYVGIFSDITLEGLDPAQIGQLALYDPLTGLATGPLLIDHLYEAAHHCERTGRHAALLYLNVDDFGALNATHGHAVGDALIKATAERLESMVRQNDTVVRAGGDEFAVILREVAAPEDVERVADKLLRQIAAPLAYSGESLSATASMGVSIYPDHGEDLDQLVEMAKQALLQAKAAGKNRWVMHSRDPDGKQTGSNLGNDSQASEGRTA